MIQSAVFENDKGRFEAQAIRRCEICDRDLPDERILSCNQECYETWSARERAARVAWSGEALA